MVRTFIGGAGGKRLSCHFTAFAALSAAIGSPWVSAEQVDLAGPPGSVEFGSNVVVLPNGNFVVVDRVGPGPNLGAVHLYSSNGQLVSTLTGSQSNDWVGSDGIEVLANGNFVVRSSYWDNAGAVDAGAVTWVDGDTGLDGTVSAANSLVGTSADDQVGRWRVTALANGNYVVNAPNWNGDMVADLGAVTWANGATGLSGPISAANSLIGSAAGDIVGSRGVYALANGNYVVGSDFWGNGTIGQVGAVTWANGNVGISGTISPANSLVGTTAGDRVSSAGVTALDIGNYVVSSSLWDNGAVENVGAVTWADGNVGLTGTVAPENSLIGSSRNDQVGSDGITALRNGNYVVRSMDWQVSANLYVGAVTWANGSTGLVDTVSPSNSLIGSATSSRVGNGGITALSNGNFVVASPLWDDASGQDVGAVTWANGNAGIAGSITPANSLIGTQPAGQIGNAGVIALSDGNFVVSSPLWNDGALIDVGAATWANGNQPLTDAISSANSLVGATAGSLVGSYGSKAVGNGSYVVISNLWDNDPIADVGAVTWVNGSAGPTGAVSASNSLTGTTANDQVGNGGVVVLANGNYVVSSPRWSNGSIAEVGAATWADGFSGRIGAVSPANSLIGTMATDRVGSTLVLALSDGKYVVCSSSWNNGAILNADAATLGASDGSTIGMINSQNSVLGTVTTLSWAMSIGYDPSRERLAVGRRVSNVVSLLTPFAGQSLVFANGFE